MLFLKYLKNVIMKKVMFIILALILALIISFKVANDDDIVSTDENDVVLTENG
jgi:uncharacterized protein YxeA